MMTLYVAVAFGSGIIAGLALWQFVAMPTMERRHEKEFMAMAKERDRFSQEASELRSKVGHLKAHLSGLSKSRK